MVKVDSVFDAAESLTPEFAAKLSDCASRFESTVSLECGGKQLCLDSLIGILALELYRGVKVSIIAEGADAEEATEAIRRMIIDKEQ